MSWVQTVARRLYELPSEPWLQENVLQLLDDVFDTIPTVGNEARPLGQACESALMKLDLPQRHLLDTLAAFLREGCNAGPATSGKARECAQHLLSAVRQHPEMAPQLISYAKSKPCQWVFGVLPDVRNFIGALFATLRHASEDQLASLTSVPVISMNLEMVLRDLTKRCVSWFESAPKFPATASALAELFRDILASPIFTAFGPVQAPALKERFLVAVSHILVALGERLAWMCSSEPDVARGADSLRERYFTVPARGVVLDEWRTTRIRRYNREAQQAIFGVLDSPQKEEMVSACARVVASTPSATADLEIKEDQRKFEAAIMEFLEKNRPDVEVHPHTLSTELLVRVASKMEAFEVQGSRLSVRAGAGAVHSGAAPAESMGGVDNLVDLLLSEALERLPDLDAIGEYQRLRAGVYRFGKEEVSFYSHNGALFVGMRNGVQVNVAVDSYLQSLADPEAASSLRINPELGSFVEASVCKLP
jgi:hypothetical protein